MRNRVALRKESVDRNYPPIKPLEIGKNVALRKESVDRNPLDYITNGGPIMVALRKESVDRNTNNPHILVPCFSRSPQGERG